MQRKEQFYNNLRYSIKGHLFIKDYIYTKPKVGKIWECICDCGKTVYLSTSQITAPSCVSCPECAIKANRKRSQQQLSKHGKHNTRIYRIWRAMISRCSFIGDTNYKHYGGRGITFCQEWNEFMPFYNWAIANDYQENLTLDRINVNGNYEPSNCRWITQKEQCNNKRTSVFIAVDGVKKHSNNGQNNLV